MSADLIVSYDATANDEDALALAYVRHARERSLARERGAQDEAERLLHQGALGLERPETIDRHVVVHASTPAGLTQLAREQGASVIVFGSEYRTSPGRAEPGASAQQLLDGGPVAVAVAAAGLRTSRAPSLRTIAVAPPGQDAGAEATARALADALRADLVELGSDADLIVVGSQVGGPPGRISLSGRARAALNAVRGSVLVVPCGVTVTLGHRA